ncbi:AAA family ATPase [Taibaiella koreensis]|uniref:AAA family ATPase n=1 Tax=Taibaiella koreensis TaxID=1268548 RepID=UPI000E59E1FF|nr:AAA family ATPase [Taibaiella koreensis]
MNTLFQDRSFDHHTLFDNYYIEVKSLYLSLFGMLPDIHYIGHINGEKLHGLICAQFGSMVLSTHHYRIYEAKKKTFPFDRTAIILNNRVILECDEEFIDIFHDGSQATFVGELTELARHCRERVRHYKAEVNLVIRGYNGLELKSMEIKRTRLNLDLYYEDDFKPVDELIRKRLNRKEDKGIILLHGVPGTGKTTYLRYLIAKIKKRVLFLSPDTAGCLMEPAFIQLLINNPDSVIVIEDAENIIMDRRSNSNSSVSNLLNISDGLLSDFLNVQLICTFNSALTLIDPALMRKGRLIAQYEFRKLSVVKPQRLSDKLGHVRCIKSPMTIAEITHPQEHHASEPRTKVIGFRRPDEQMAR